MNGTDKQFTILIHLVCAFLDDHVWQAKTLPQLREDTRRPALVRTGAVIGAKRRQNLANMRTRACDKLRHVQAKQETRASPYFLSLD